MRLRADHSQVTSAAKAGHSVATGRRTETDPLQIETVSTTLRRTTRLVFESN